MRSGLLGQHLVKVSAKSARLKFIACGPTCIATGCVAKCCDAPTHPDGCRVYVHPDEAEAIKARYVGVKIKDGFLQRTNVRPGCPFKRSDHLCFLWQKPERPFGCIVSPFMLNGSDTLIVRNRYKLLPCYDPAGGKPAYEVFRSSLLTVFGEAHTSNLIWHLERGGGDYSLPVSAAVYKKLKHREVALHKG